MFKGRNYYTLLICFLTFLFIAFNISHVNSEEDDVKIPEDAHSKAIEALKALGPERGGKKIDYHSSSIIGLNKGLVVSSEKLKSAINDLGANQTEMEILIELSDNVLFDFDKWDIRKDGEDSLKKIGDIIKAYKSPKVIISGHTDSKGSEEYNMQLSKKRAESIKKWLVDKENISSEIIETAGFGETRPKVPNVNPDGSDNPEGRQKNRRVEIIIKK